MKLSLIKPEQPIWSAFLLILAVHIPIGVIVAVLGCISIWTGNTNHVEIFGTVLRHGLIGIRIRDGTSIFLSFGLRWVAWIGIMSLLIARYFPTVRGRRQFVVACIWLFPLAIPSIAMMAYYLMACVSIMRYGV